MQPWLLVLTIVFGLSRASQAHVENPLGDLLDKISTTISEVAWNGKHDSEHEHNSLMELLINETIRLAEPEIRRLQELLTGSDPEYLTQITKRLVEDSTRKVEDLDDSDDDPLAPRFLCRVEKVVKKALAAGIGGFVGGAMGVVEGVGVALNEGGRGCRGGWKGKCCKDSCH